MTPEEKAVEQFMAREELPYAIGCGCMGPQGDDPLCPCAMQWTEIVDNHIYKIDWKKGGYVATLVK